VPLRDGRLLLWRSPAALEGRLRLGGCTYRRVRLRRLAPRACGARAPSADIDTRIDHLVIGAPANERRGGLTPTPPPKRPDKCVLSSHVISASQLQVMVLYFTCDLVSPPYTMYMGADKHENEELIRWGWPEDVWFHVDKLSSAHVYLRLRPGETLDDVPTQVIDACAQLVKANSIEGSKQNNVDIVYTMWDNLKKTGDMAVGQVGFHKSKQVRKVHVERRVPQLLKPLEKSKREEFPDLRALREERDARERQDLKAAERERKRAAEEEKKRKAEEKQMKSYDRLFDESKMVSNKDMSGYDSDDFIEIYGKPIASLFKSAFENARKKIISVIKMSSQQRRAFAPYPTAAQERLNEFQATVRQSWYRNLEQCFADCDL
uniref:Coiled-coil domain-containing protein 25 n=1 Tax=Macrostomum lignano TaxID=282301 RepID=A0A1I8IQ77_9PLAT